MEQYPMVYRSAIIMAPMEPFLNWINRVSPSEILTLTDVQKDSNVYLIPDYDLPISEEDLEKEIKKYIRKHYKGIFYNQLSEWYLDEKTYPEMTYEIFNEWFKVSIHTIIFDMVNKPIKKEG